MRLLLGRYDPSKKRVKDAEAARQNFQDKLTKLFPKFTITTMQQFYEEQNVFSPDDDPLYAESEIIFRDLVCGDIIIEGGRVPLSIEFTSAKVDTGNISLTYNKRNFCDADVHVYCTPQGIFCRIKRDHISEVNKAYDKLQGEDKAKADDSKNGYMLLSVRPNSTKIENDADLIRFIHKAIIDKYTGFSK